MARTSSCLVAGILFFADCCLCQQAFRNGSDAKPGLNTNYPTFAVTGLVVSVTVDEKQAVIKHLAIPGYMPSMTMPFKVKDKQELARLSPGNTVAFRLNVTGSDSWIDQVRSVSVIPTNGPPANSQIRVVRDVQPLELGEPLSEYHLINESGHPFSTQRFQGQALAITFLFTRCPLPNFCPLMATHFAQAQKKLLSMANAPTNWHLLTISFDPEFDKPEVLKAYAHAYGYDPKHWTFATGKLEEITAIGDQLGLTFWHDQTGSISHNLRTVVIDSRGRLQKIFQGNAWTVDELMAELFKAAR
jgi:protein SCO1/2